MQKLLNLKVKYRESFRPFAPSVLRQRMADWFDLDDDSPYMLLVAEVSERCRVPVTSEQQRFFGIERLNVPRSSIPAVTHVDYSARNTDGAPRNESAIPCLDFALLRADRLPCGGEHELQCPRRAHRMHA